MRVTLLWEGFGMALSLRPGSSNATAIFILQLGKSYNFVYSLLSRKHLLYLGLITLYMLNDPYLIEDISILISSIRRVRKQNTKVLYRLSEKFLRRYIRLVL